jgi:TatD DNase family protein
MWFDAHCHLFSCSGDASDVIARARSAGVEEMLVAATDLETSRTALSLAGAPGVYAAVGVHPNESLEWNAEAAQVLEDQLRHPAAVAVGETGLDFYRDTAPRDVQREAFVVHIELARRFDKALVVHTRDAVDSALDALEKEGPPDRVVFHCWSGGLRQMERALELGAFISFAGNVSFRSAADLRGLAALVPDDRLVVETDSPYLAPAPHRGRPNEPAFVALVGAVVAGVRGVTSDRLAKSTTTNARRLFGLEIRSYPSCAIAKPIT